MSAPTPGRPPAGHIVVGVDGSPSSEQALRWAAARARLTGQELHAVTTWQLPVPYDGWVIDEFDWAGDAADALQKSLDNVLSGADAPAVVQHVLQGHPAKVLLEQAGPDDVLVVGTRGHSGFPGLILGSVSQHVIGHASCPVVVVHGNPPPAGRIVVGVDGSAASQTALRWAARQAAVTGSPLRAVLAWQRPLGYGLLDRPAPDWAASAEHALAAAVTEALGADGAPPVEREVVEGQPAEVLLRGAEGAGLLVVGSRGRGGFAGLALGSVSRHVAAHATCPVAVHRG